MNTKENVLCEEKKEEKIKRRWWRVQILREVGKGRAVVSSTSEFSAREHEKDDGGMMTRFGFGAAGCFELRPMSGVGFVTLSVFVCEGDSAYFCLLL